MESSGTLKFYLVSSSIGCLLAAIGVSKLVIDIESESLLKDSTMQESIASDNNETGETKSSQKKLQKELTKADKIIIVATVGVLVVVNFLMLVVTGGPLWLSVVTNLAVIGIFLRPQITDEIKRERYERLSAILCLFLFIACKLCIATYARKALDEGNIYRGPARIVGYDDSNYSNDGEDVIRTDLEVAWGDTWGCGSSEIQCRGFVNGAMCESKTDDRSLSNYYENDDFGSDSLYHFGDDNIEDNSYWHQDWNSIWGDYACKNLFETYVDLMEYNADEPPGEDGWPFVNIYGNCKTCSAYIVDYYSTQHFSDIKKFKTRARNYFISAIVFLALTLGLKAQRDQIIATKKVESADIINDTSSLEFECTIMN